MLFSAKVGVAGLVVALAAGLAAPAAVAAPSDDRRAAVAKPTLKASRAAVVSGDRLVLAGRVKPARKGAVVILQKLTAGKKKWANEARLKAGKGGVFRYADKPRTAGVRHYRVVVPKTGKVKQGVSKVVRVTVYRWQNLNDVRARRTEWTYFLDKALINGTDYRPAIVGRHDYSNEGYADWNLNRSCRQLQTRIGNGDDSDDRAIANVSLVADGKSVYAKSFGLAQSESITVDLRGVFRLAFNWTSTNPDGTPEDQSGASATLGEPRVLCAF